MNYPYLVVPDAWLLLALLDGGVSGKFLANSSGHEVAGGSQTFDTPKKLFSTFTKNSKRG